MWSLSAPVVRVLDWNNARVHRLDPDVTNPRPLDDVDWRRALVARHPAIRAEWDRFTASGGDLPLIDDVLGHPDQNEGSYWKLAPLVEGGRPVRGLADAFPETTAAMRAVPGLRAACWSVLGPGAVIPEHVGENAGCLRLLVAVDASGSTLTVAGRTVRCVDGEALLFDDTVPHAAANPRTTPRVLLLCDLLRSLPQPAATLNRAVQALLRAATPEYRHSAARARRRFGELNPGAQRAAPT